VVRCLLSVRVAELVKGVDRGMRLDNLTKVSGYSDRYLSIIRTLPVFSINLVRLGVFYTNMRKKQLTLVQGVPEGLNVAK
jgi:hypothetical protein